VTPARRLGTLAATAAVAVAVLAVFFVLPVSGMVSRGFVPDGHLDVGGVLDVLTRPEIRRAVWFTVWTSTVATALACGLGLPAAYVLHRVTIPGRAAIRAVLVVPFVLPTVVVGVAFGLVIGDGGPLSFLGLDGSPVAIVAGLVFFNASVVIRVVGGAWESLDTRPAEAAAALGASPRQVLRDVTLPALRPAIVSAATVVFLFCATAFGIVLTLGGLRYSGERPPDLRRRRQDEPDGLRPGVAEGGLPARRRQRRLAVVPRPVGRPGRADPGTLRPRRGDGGVRRPVATGRREWI
jgi:thiamine transport system permease protein